MTLPLPVRIGIIGGGGIANANLKGYGAIPDRARALTAMTIAANSAANA